jgi:hypothetical protein
MLQQNFTTYKKQLVVIDGYCPGICISTESYSSTLKIQATSSAEMLVPSAKIHGITFYKTAIFTFTIQNLKSHINFYISSLDTQANVQCSSPE